MRWLWALALAGRAAAGPESPAGAARNDWYWNSLVNLHMDNHGLSVGKGRTVADVAERLSRLPVDIVQVSAYGADGARTTYPSALLPGDPDGWDTLAVWGQAARAAGKRFHVYVNTRGLALTRQRPEWTQLDAAGRGHGRKGGLDACPRLSPDRAGYLEALLRPLLEEVMTRYRPDGIWVDGDHARTRTCYCPHCVAAWRADVADQPPPTDRTSREWPRWLAFQQERYDDYRRQMAEIVHRIHPPAFYTSNHAWKRVDGPPDKNDPRSAPAFADTISADLSHGQALRSTRLKALFLSAERTTPWDLMHLIYRPGEISRHRVLQQGAITLAHGGSWFLWRPGNGDPLAEAPFARAMECAQFVRARAAALGRSESANPVAVLISETAWERERTGGCEGWADLDAPGHWALAIEDACVGVDLINEADFAAASSSYRAILVPNQREVAAATASRLWRFAEAGGTLILAGSALSAHGETATERAGVARGNRRGGDGIARLGGRRIALEGRWELSVRNADVLARWDDGAPMATSRPLGRGRVVVVGADRMPTPDLDGFAPRRLDLCGIGPMVRMTGPGRTEQFIFTLRRRAGNFVVHLADVGARVRGVRILDERTQRIDDTPPVEEVTVHMACAQPHEVAVVPASTRLDYGWTNGLLTATLRHVAHHAALMLDAAPTLLPPGMAIGERHPLSHHAAAAELAEDFELASRGQAVRLVGPWALRSREPTTIRITDTTAASGRHSLEFIDAPCDPPYLPMLCVLPRMRAPFVFSCALKLGTGAVVAVEFREQENRREHPVGPSLTFNAKTGRIISGGQDLGACAVDPWCWVEVRVPSDGSGTYSLRVMPAQGPAVERDGLPFVNAAFSKCGWIGVIGAGPERARFFLDHVQIRPLVDGPAMAE